MNFVTLEFAIFFSFTLTILYFFQYSQNAYKTALLTCNIVFYAYAGTLFLPLLFTVVIINWSVGKLLFYVNTPYSKKFILSLAILLHILLLVFFKYYEFFILSIESILSILHINPELSIIDIAFPIGLSFYTFQGLSYSIDQYRSPATPPESFFNLCIFISFFPTVLAGPIIRKSQFFPQLLQRDTTSETFITGFALILSGLFKKVVIASYLSEHIVRDIFQSPELYSSWAVLTAVYSYSIQIFCDFSGYSDLAIGIGALMGYQLPQNFNAPYLAKNLQIFWHRWHITLSQWLRDYLYIPLGGNKRHQYFNLIITMIIGGLWHGSHIRFLIWGFLHGVGLVVVHLTKRIIATKKYVIKIGTYPFIQNIITILSWIITFHFISFLWIFFRADDLPRCIEILKRIIIFGQTGNGFPILVIPAILTGLLIQIIGPYILTCFVSLQKRLPWVIQAVILAFLGGLILKMGPDGIMPFIYFQF